MKKCFQCKETKEKIYFYKTKLSKDGHSCICKNCQLENERTNNKKAREWLDDLKSKNPCERCGEKRFYVIDIHHLDPSKKTITVSSYAVSGTSKFETKQKRILEELKNCIFLCANCHREEHWKQRNNLLP